MDLAESSEYGYACAMPFFLDGSGIFTEWQQHGMCEAYSERPAGKFRWEIKGS